MTHDKTNVSADEKIPARRMGVLEQRRRGVVCMAIMRDYMDSDLSLEQLEVVRENILYSLNN